MAGTMQCGGVPVLVKKVGTVEHMRCSRCEGVTWEIETDEGPDLEDVLTEADE
jgi:hypothetical protein